MSLRHNNNPNKTLQIVITVVLTLILMGLITTYIIIGMRHSSNKVALPVIPTINLATSSATERKQEILQALNTAPPVDISFEKRQATLDALASSPISSDSTSTSKQAILDALNASDQ